MIKASFVEADMPVDLAILFSFLGLPVLGSATATEYFHCYLFSEIIATLVKHHSFTAELTDPRKVV